MSTTEPLIRCGFRVWLCASFDCVLVGPRFLVSMIDRSVDTLAVNVDSPQVDLHRCGAIADDPKHELSRVEPRRDEDFVALKQQRHGLSVAVFVDVGRSQLAIDVTHAYAEVDVR